MALGSSRPRSHDWETAGTWGVVLGVSRCRKCGAVARAEHFEARTNPPPTGPDSHTPRNRDRSKEAHQ